MPHIKPADVRSDRDYPSAFQEWWKAYPRHVNKKGCYRNWRNLVDNQKVSLDDLQRAAEIYAARVAGTDPMYIMHGTTFLGRDGRYEEYLEREESLWDAYRERVERLNRLYR